MKKAIVIILLAICCIGLFGCKEETPTTETNKITYVGSDLDFGDYDINKGQTLTSPNGKTYESKTIKEIVGNVRKADVEQAILKEYASRVNRNNQDFDINTFDTSTLSYSFRFIEHNSFFWNAYEATAAVYAILETPSYGYVYEVSIRNGEISSVYVWRTIYSNY